MNIIPNRKNYVVLVWPDPNHHVPIIYGPYRTNEEALQARDHFRSIQRREEKMAQATTIVANKRK